MFIALSGENVTVDKLLMLSPRVMKWGNGQWLFDLSVTSTYWRLQAEARSEELTELYRQVIEEIAGDDYVAVVARQPWQALLLVTYLRERGLSGLVERSGRVGSGLFRDVSWQSWWDCCEQLAKHMERAKVKRFNLVSFRRSAKNMRVMVERLCLESPWAIQAVGAYAVRRRYGAWFKLIWEWSYGDASPESGFPWYPYSFPQSTQIERQLETPLMEWEHLEEFLREDFDQLCHADRLDAREKVVSLEWRLTLDNMAYLCIPVFFRYPHALHLERPSHRTALLQAHYSFERVMREANQQSLDDTGVLPPPIVGWQLRVKERLIMPPQAIDLFGSCANDEATLLHLENRLAVPLHSYDVRNDWSAEESFAVYERDETRLDDESNLHFSSLCAMAQRRPLFMLKRQQKLQRQCGRSTLWEFRERTMDKWWRPEQRGLARDYYRYIDEKKRAWWVYRANQDQWYVQGVFA